MFKTFVLSKLQEDCGVGSKPCCANLHSGYTIYVWKGWDGVNFRRTLWGGFFDAFGKCINADCADVVLNDQRDTARWTLTTSGKFTVKSLYQKMILNNC